MRFGELSVGFRSNGVEIDLGGHAVKEVADLVLVSSCMMPKQSITYRPRMPPVTSYFEPREMPAKRGGAKDSVRVLLELLKWNGLVHRNLPGVLAVATSRIRVVLAGSSRAEMARNGILIARTASEDEASR